MKATRMILLAAVAATGMLTSCGPWTEVSMGVGSDVGYDPYYSVAATLPIAVTHPVYNPGLWGGWNRPAPLAPRPVSGPAILPSPPANPGPVVGNPGFRPGVGQGPGANTPAPRPTQGNGQRPGANLIVNP